MLMLWSDSPASSSREAQRRRAQEAAAATTTVFAVGLSFLLLVIPPWQQPDGRYYMACVRLLTSGAQGRSFPGTGAYYVPAVHPVGEPDPPAARNPQALAPVAFGGLFAAIGWTTVLLPVYVAG